MKRLLALLLALCLICGCSAKPVTAQGFAMDTILSVSLYQGGSQALAQEALSLADEAEARLSCHREGTEISRLNQEGSATLSPETAELLAFCLDMYAASSGALDIGLGGVSALWDFSAEQPSLPEESALLETLSHAGADGLRLDGNEATLLDPCMQLDLGAVAKGALADDMAALLRERGVTSFLLNLGGCLYLSGGKDGEPFRVGVEDPRQSGSMLGVLYLTEGAVSTSSGAQRGFTLDGVRYHHILDPKTGYPADAGLLSVTVVCPSGLLADALSTACFVLGEEGAAALLAQFPQASALLLLEDGSLRVLGSLDFEPA